MDKWEYRLKFSRDEEKELKRVATDLEMTLIDVIRGGIVLMKERSHVDLARNVAIIVADELERRGLVKGLSSGVPTDTGNTTFFD